MESSFAARGQVSARLIRAPKASLFWKVKNLPHVLPGWAQDAIAHALGMNHMSARLYARKRLADGRWLDYGLISTQKVTTAFCAFMVDQLQTETSAWGDFKYHDTGTGTTAENNGDTSMETVSTVMVGDVRAVGTQIEGATAVVYKSVATVNYDGAAAITEHGLFDDTRANGGVLMDRSVFSAINVANGDSIEFTYQLTCTAGG